MFEKISPFLSSIRLRIKSMLSPNSGIVLTGFSRVNRNTAIEVANKSLLKIGKGVYTRQGVALSVRDGATLELGNGVFINRNTIITSRRSIIIEDGVTIGPNVCIYDHDHDVHNRGEYVLENMIVKKNAWIGSGVIILKGVTIGENAVVASGSVVTKDVPDNTILIQKRQSFFKKYER